MAGKGASWLAVTLLVVTLGVLGQSIFFGASRPQAVTAETSSRQALYRQVAEMPLGQVEVYNFQRMGFTHGYLTFSPDGRYLAVGTENGDVICMTRQGEKLWQRPSGVGKISALTFAADSQLLLLGETSPQGSLTALSVADGAVRWRFDTAADLAPDIKRKVYPGIVHVTTDAKGGIYAVGQRYQKKADGSSEYRGRIYKLDTAGQTQAVFPPEGLLDAWVSWVSVSHSGERLVFGTGNWDVGKECQYRDTVYCLNADWQTAAWSRYIEPVAPYQNTTMRSSPDVDGDGSAIAGIANDGRCFFYDESGQERWRRSLSTPQKINGVYLNATGMFVRMAGERVVFTTGNTYNRANWQLPTPVEHPASNRLFVFNREGRLLESFATGGMAEQVAVAADVVAVAVGRSIRTKDVSVHGVQVFDLLNVRLLDQMSMTGPCVSVAMTPDGRTLAAVEAPLQLEDGSIIGEYRLHVWERK